MTERTRRATLALGASAVPMGLAGCTNTDIPFGPSESTSLFLTNQIDEERTVTVVLEEIDGDGDRLIEETVTVDPDDTHGFSDPVNEDVRVTIRVEDGPEETYEWTETGPEHALSISLDADSIGFTVATKG